MKRIETISFNEGSQKLIETSLDPLKVGFTCTVSGTTQSEENGGLTKGNKVTDVKVRLTFTGTSLFDAIRFASGGQSFRVAVQSRLRTSSVKSLKNDVHDFMMSDVFNPPKRTVVVDPKLAVKRNAKKLMNDGMSKAEIMAMLDELEED